MANAEVGWIVGQHGETDSFPCACTYVADILKGMYYFAKVHNVV